MEEYLMFAKVQDGTYSMSKDEQSKCIDEIRRLRDQVTDLQKTCIGLLKFIEKLNDETNAELMRHGQ